MFSKISWADYWLSVGSITVCYYLAVAAIYYRTEITALLRGKKAAAPAYQPAAATASIPDAGRSSNLQAATHAKELLEEETEEQEEEMDEEAEEQQAGPLQYAHPAQQVEIMKAVSALSAAISTMMDETGADTGRAELMEKVSRIIAETPSYKTLLPFRESLNWHIQQEAFDVCNIDFDDADIDAIWKMATEK